MHCGKKQENYATLAFQCDSGLKRQMSRHPPSPCNSVCRIDPASGFCLGCKRTLEEIADWPMLTAGEKRVVLAALDRRGISSAS